MSRTDEELRATLDRISKERATMKPGEYPEEQPTPPMTKTRELEVVAWRVKDFADGWMLSNIETAAMAYQSDGHLVEPLVTEASASATIEEMEERIAALMAERTSLIETKRKQIERLTKGHDEAVASSKFFEKECWEQQQKLEAAEAERDALRKALGNLLPHVECVQDEGPDGDGWQSDKLSTAIAEARQALSGSKG